MRRKRMERKINCVWNTRKQRWIIVCPQCNHNHFKAKKEVKKDLNYEKGFFRCEECKFVFDIIAFLK